MSDADVFQKIVDALPTRVSLTFARYEGADEDDADVPSAPPKEVLVILGFSEKGFGFGEVTLKQTPEGVFLDTERMSKEHVLRYFAALIESAVADTDEDPEKHALYNRVMGRRCGPQCLACKGEEHG